MSAGSGVKPRPITVTGKLGDFQFRVKPGHIRVAASYGELPNCLLVNETDFDVEFWFPEGLMQYPDGKPAMVVPIPKGGASVPVDVNVAKSGEFPYPVRVYPLRPFYLEASGGSRPEVEVKP